MKVSIIIPAYNEEQYLPVCLDSVFNVNYPRESFEVIVVDNGSTDRTREIATSFGAKVLCDDSLNVSGLRNLGAKCSEGDILAFVDADCVVSKDWLQNAARYFNDTGVVVWGGPPVPPDDTTWVQKTWFLVLEKSRPVEDAEWIGTIDLFVRREQFMHIGCFNEALNTCEDVDFCYRISQYGKIVSDAAIGVIHLREANTVMEFMKKEIWRGQSNLSGIKSHGLTLKELPSLSIPLYFGLLLPASLLTILISLNTTLIFICILLYLVPSAYAIVKVRRKKIGVIPFFRLFFLLQIYFFARTVAVFQMWK